MGYSNGLVMIIQNLCQNRLGYSNDFVIFIPNSPKRHMNPYPDRPQRLHELLIALIHKQKDLELMDSEAPVLDNGGRNIADQDPAKWLDRNRRVLKKYQGLVRTAITLDALLDAEHGNS